MNMDMSSNSMGANGLRKTPLTGAQKLREKKRRAAGWKASIPLFALAAPALIYVFIFNYLPMIGSVMAFQNFKPSRGIFNSEFIGFENFEFIFSSQGFGAVLWNTVGYHIAFFVLQTIAAIFIALMLYEITGRRKVKLYQSSMLLPNFISWVLVAYIVFTFLSHEQGLLNRFFESLGLSTVKWYSEPKYWPVILAVTSVWKSFGQASVLYYAALMGLDESLFEAAKIDGAGRFKRMWHISMPSLMPIISILSILAMGSLMSNDIGLFFQVPLQSSALFSTTDVINTYVTRALLTQNYAIGSAVGLFQSVVGMVMILTTNGIIRRISPDKAMF